MDLAGRAALSQCKTSFWSRTRSSSLGFGVKTITFSPGSITCLNQTNPLRSVKLAYDERSERPKFVLRQQIDLTRSQSSVVAIQSYV